MLKTKNKLKSIIAIAGVITLTCSLSISQPVKVDAADIQSVATATVTTTTSICQDGLQFTLREDGRGHYITVRLDTNTDPSKVSTVTVPSELEINGQSYYVMEVEQNAFANSSLSSITLPDNMTAIGSNAFSGCNNLKSLTLPSRLNSIGKHAIWGTGISTLKIPNTVSDIENEAIGNNPNLSYITVADGSYLWYTSYSGVLAQWPGKLISFPTNYYSTDYHVDYTNDIIGTGSIVYTNAHKITLDEGVKTIEQNSIMYNSKLEEIYISSTVDDISESFSTDTNLKLFVVSPDNKYFSADKDGSLCSKDGTKLIRCSSSVGSSYDVGDKVTTIDSNAFAGLDVSTITVPYSFNATSTENQGFINSFSGNVNQRAIASIPTATASETPVSTSTVASSTPTTNSGVASATATTNPQANTATASQSVGTTVQNSTSTATTVSNGSKTGDISSLPYVIATFAGLASSVAIRKRK